MLEMVSFGSQTRVIRIKVLFIAHRSFAGEPATLYSEYFISDRI